MSRSPNRMIRKGKSPFVYFAAAVIVSCYLAQTIDCLRLKKTERREGRRELDTAKTTALQEGRILFGKAFEKGSSFESQDIDGTKKLNDSSEDDSAYQADYGGWSMVPTQDLLSREALWRRMTPSLQCGGDQLRFRAVGPGVTHFRIGNAPPMPLSQVPSSCGYTMQRNPFALVMQVPYDGCNMVQEGGHYMLPMQWQGVPVSLMCPKPPAPQQHYGKTPDMSYSKVPQASYYPQQHLSYPQQQQQHLSYPQYHQQQHLSYPQQQQHQHLSYPQQHQQFPEPSKAQPAHAAYPYPFYPFYYPSYQWPQKGPQQTTTPTTTQPTTTHPSTTTTTPPPTTTTKKTTTTTTTTKPTTKPQIPQFPPYMPYFPPYPFFPPFVPPFPLPTTKPTTTKKTTTTTKAPAQTAPPLTPSPLVFPPNYRPPFPYMPIPPNYPLPYFPPPMFRP